MVQYVRVQYTSSLYGDPTRDPFIQDANKAQAHRFFVLAGNITYVNIDFNYCRQERKKGGTWDEESDQEESHENS